jgi:hypothetical protein
MVSPHEAKTTFIQPLSRSILLTERLDRLETLNGGENGALD